MNHYGKLADSLSSRRWHGASQQEIAHEVDGAKAYERVKVLVDHEIEKANGELRKRKLDLIERLFLPSYQGRLCLTFGSDLLCTVDLQEVKRQITAVISGPPNHREIARKEFALHQYRPEQIAVEVVSGLIMGEFS